MLKLPFLNNVVRSETTFKPIQSKYKHKAFLTYSNSKDDFVKKNKEMKELWVQ